MSIFTENLVPGLRGAGSVKSTPDTKDFFLKKDVKVIILAIEGVKWTAFKNRCPLNLLHSYTSAHSTAGLYTLKSG